VVSLHNQGWDIRALVNSLEILAGNLDNQPACLDHHFLVNNPHGSLAR
jgi:hypothetical protein